MLSSLVQASRRVARVPRLACGLSSTTDSPSPDTASSKGGIRREESAVEHVDIHFVKPEEPPALVASRQTAVNFHTSDRFELRGELKEMEHLRGGLGGLAPMHVNIDSRVIHGFRWVQVEDLLAHEHIKGHAASALREYLETSLSSPKLAPSIPAIVACSRTNTIIDGHHRWNVVQDLGFPLAPVVYIDYGHSDVLVHVDQDNPVSKQDVIDSALSGVPMTPKSTAHVIRAGDGSLHPVVSLSPNCTLFPHGQNLTGGWSYSPRMKRKDPNGKKSGSSSA